MTLTMVRLLYRAIVRGVRFVSGRGRARTQPV